MTVRFTVPRKPVSVNAAYRRARFSARRGAGGGKGFVLTPEARDFKAAVFGHALLARRKADWPSPVLVRSVSLAIVTWNSRHDADAPIKLLQDALEGVFYASDRVVRRVSADRARDGGPPRIDVEVTLLEAA